MGETADFFADEDVPRARVAVLLKHSSRLRRVRGLAARLGRVLSSTDTETTPAAPKSIMSRR